MASLKLVVGSTITDLMEGDDGYKLRLDGWTPQVAQDRGDGYEDVVETITLKAVGSSVSNLASMVTEDIENTIQWANERINDVVAPDLAYLRWIVSGQSVARQALIRRLSYSLGNSPFFPPVTTNSTFPNLTLSVERFPFWETITPEIIVIENFLAGGDSKDLETERAAPGVIRKGSVPGRIGQLEISGDTLTEFWMGFRTNKYGLREYFEPVWAFDTVTTSNDATASGGTVTWNSGDSDLLERMRISMSQVSAISSTHRDYQRGTFAVLLRARSTGTETFNVRLSDGLYSSNSNWNTHSRVKVSGTSFLFYPLGTITIPPAALRDSSLVSSILKAYTLRLEAEVNTAGTGSFEATRFVLIPQDEGFVHVKGITASSLTFTFVTVGPDGRISAFTRWNTLNQVDIPTELDEVSYALPKDRCNIVFAGHGSSQSLTSATDLRIEYYARWLSLGGVN